MIMKRISEIDNIEILADASNAMSMLKPKPVTMGEGQLRPQQQQQHQSEDELSSSSSRHRRNKRSSQLTSNNNNGNGSRNGGLRNGGGSFDQINTRSLAMEEEFDFEKNLALFDKNAFYEEMMHNEAASAGESSYSSLRARTPTATLLSSSSDFLQIFAATTSLSSSSATAAPLSTSKSSNSLPVNSNRNDQHNHQHSNNINNNNNHNSSSFIKNYRFDEMVLDTGEPINFQQIQVF